MMNAVHNGFTILVVALAGVLLVVASGAVQIYLPEYRWKQAAIQYLLNLSSISIIVNTVLVWVELDRLLFSPPVILLLVLALAIPLLLSGVMMMAWYFTIRWVRRRQPEVEYPYPELRGLSRLIEKIRKW